MNLTTNTSERDSIEEIFGRSVFVPALNGYLDPQTGDVWPLIAGAEGDDGNEGAGEGEGGEGEEGDEGEGESDEKQRKADRAKIERSAGKKANRKLARDLGFNSVGEMRTKLGEQNTSSDSSKTKNEGEGESSSKSENTSRNDEADRRSKVTIAVAESGIDPKKIRKASKLVFSELDGDDFDSDDLSDAIDELREDEPGWFPSSSTSDEGDEGKGRSVSGPNLQRRKKTTGKSVVDQQLDRFKAKPKSFFDS